MTQPSSRMTWMDTLRGSAIVLVILWHSAAILLIFDFSVPRWLITANEVMAPYRMPVLMFLSGMLLNRALAKPLGVYLTGKLRHIAWPWFVWSLVNILVMSPNTGVLTLPTWFFSYLWFLAYIMSYYMIAPFVRWVPAPLLAVGFALLSLPMVDSDDLVRRRYCFLAIFFFLGQWASEQEERFQRVVASRYVWAIVPIALGFGLASAIHGPWRYFAVTVPFSLLGIVVAAKASMRIPDGRTHAVRFVGRNSLIYYVTHFPAIAILVQAAAGVGAPGHVLLPVCIVLALGVGTVSSRLAATTKARWLFEIPEGALMPRSSRVLAP